MTTTSSHMASNFEPHNVMSANVGITVKQNGQSLRTNSSNSEAQPVVGSTVAADKEKIFPSNSTLTILKKRKKSRMKN